MVYRRVLRIILAHNHGDSESREASLGALSELLKKRSLGPQLQSFTELILIQVIKAYSDPNREVRLMIFHSNFTLKYQNFSQNFSI